MKAVEKINIFKQFHKAFLDIIISDIWLCKYPIDEDEIRACWHYAVKLNIESTPEEMFEDEYGFTFKDLANWVNEEILQIDNKSI